jgi:hypothetical protein
VEHLFMPNIPEIEAMQLEIRRKMTLEQRLQVVIELLRLAFLPDPLTIWVK